MDDNITMKDLCLLHERDSEGKSRRFTEKDLNDPNRKIMWADLQSMMQLDYYDDSIIHWLHKQERLDDEKYKFWFAANKFQKFERTIEGLEVFEVRAYPSIYHAIWDNDDIGQPESIFRGQFDARWTLESSLLRPDGNKPLTVERLLERTELTETFLQALRPRQVELLGKELTEEELLAVAQHFGFPTPLMDYTRSLRIAAWFATSDAKNLKHDDPPVTGIIYHMSILNDGQEIHRDAGESIGLPLFDLISLRIGQLNTIEPDIPFEDNRIRRQQGVFISGFNPQDLQNIAIDVIYFQQQPGVVFEDPRASITNADLLPSGTALSNLAEEVKRGFKSNRNWRVSPLMGETHFAQRGIIGTRGHRLSAQISNAEDFFSQLRVALDSINDNDSVSYFKELFESYFRAVHLEASIGKVVPDEGGDAATKAIAVAVDKLAEWSGDNDNRLWNTVRVELDYGRSIYPEFNRFNKPRFKPRNRVEEIALGCALYLAVWEHLRHVDGIQAQSLYFEVQSYLSGRHVLPYTEDNS